MHPLFDLRLTSTTTLLTAQCASLNNFPEKA